MNRNTRIVGSIIYIGHIFVYKHREKYTYLPTYIHKHTCKI